MKVFKVIVLILAVIGMAVNAQAQFGGGNFGNPVPSPTIIAASTSQTLTASQSGAVFVLNRNGGSAPNGAILTLPTATARLDYTFIVDTAVNIRIKPQAGDIINYATNVAGSKVKNTSATIGDSIELYCIVAGQWSVKNRFGTWATDNNP